eukprot:scaffold125139_cov20-Tisochrysis_lutea.AAC.2
MHAPCCSKHVTLAQGSHGPQMDSKHEILCDTSAWTTFLCGANVSSKTNLPSAYNALPDVERGGQSKQNNRIGGLGRPPEQGKSHY